MTFSQGESTLAEGVDEADRGIVRVIGETGQGYSTGTGFVINSDGLIVTNYHVVEGSNKIIIAYNDDAGNSQIFAARIIARNKINPDVAILDAGPIDRKPLSIQFKHLQKGSTVFAFGFPGVADMSTQTDSTFFESTMTKGIFSRAAKFKEGEQIQHSAIISQGNSGGPLDNTCGRVIGVNTYTAVDKTTKGNATGFGYAFHAQSLVRFLRTNNVEFEVVNQECSETELAPEKNRDSAPPASANFLTVIGIALAFVIFVLFLFMRQSHTPTFKDATDSNKASLRPPQKWLLEAEHRGLYELSATLDETKFSSVAPFVIGRSSRCDLIIPDEAASREHLMLFFEAGELFCKDLNSSNGTKLNGIKLSSHRASRIASPAELLIGRLRLTIINVS